jgi:hypothetical protein
MWTLRRLGLPLWWIFFAPIVARIWVGNLNIFVIALLLTGVPLAGGVAIVLTIYAALPLLILWRWKPLVIAGLIIVLTQLLPWSQFLADYPRISAALAGQGWGGESSLLTQRLWPRSERQSASSCRAMSEPHGWPCPVLWPATQLHYTVLALPALSPPLAVFAAYNHPGILGPWCHVFCALAATRSGSLDSGA